MKLKNFNKTINECARFNIPKNQEFIDQVSQIETTYQVQDHYHFPMKRVVAGITTFVLLFVLGFGMWANQNIVSEISLDINPSIKLSINQFGKVIDLTSTNEDGQNVINQTEFSSMSYLDVISAIYQECIDLGYTSTDSSYVLFGITSTDYDDEIALQSKISTFFEQSSANVLYVSKHSDTEYVLYAGFATDKEISPTTSFDNTDILTTTTAASQNVTTTITTTTEFNDSVLSSDELRVIELQTLSTDEFIALANTLGISEAKLQICLSVYVYYVSYHTEDGLVSLANLSLQDLFALYYQIPS